jgi:tetratricopeptide (TPR) repeat protein
MKGNPGARAPIETSTVAAICVGLTLVTLGLYAQVLGHDFLNFDDDIYVTDNPMVLNGWTWHGFVAAWTTVHAGYWIPLIWLSHMTDCALYGLNPAGHHATNVVLHAANAVLLFLLLRRMTGAVWRSATVAALFAWHPLHVESVAWITERKDVLSTLFFIGSIWLYSKYTEEFKVQGSRSKVCYSLSLLLFACALLSKPMVVTLPFVLLLLDYWPLERFGPGQAGPLILEKLPFFALSFADGVVTYLTQQSAGATEGFTPFPIRAGNAVLSYGRYLAHTVWPTRLAALYPYSINLSRLELSASWLLLVALTWFALNHRRQRYLATGWFWYLGTLVPVIGLVQSGSQSSADRFTYIPLIGIFVMIVWGVADWAAATRFPAWKLALTAGGVLAVCAGTTTVQLGYWSDSGVLFNHAIAVTDSNYMAWNNLGFFLLDQDQSREAVECFSNSLAVMTINPAGWDGMGTYWLSQKNDEMAFQCFSKALTFKKNDDGSLYNLGVYYARHGRNAEALDSFTESMRVRPRPNTCCHIGLALQALNRSTEAIPFFRQALALNPNYTPARLSLADELLAEGKNADAAIEYRKILQADPSYEPAHSNLAYALAAQGQIDEAITELQQAVVLQPSDASAHCNLGNLLAKQGKWDQAILEYRTALRFKGSSPEIHSNLGAVMAQQGHRQEAAQEFNEALRIDPNFSQAKEQLKALTDQ